MEIENPGIAKTISRNNNEVAVIHLPEVKAGSTEQQGNHVAQAEALTGAEGCVYKDVV